jgi:tRNA (guanine10-N2)-methyltransferase
MEQVVPKEPKKASVLAEDAHHFPSTSNYSVKGMYEDLLIFSTKHLKLGGRLVCWFPIATSDYHEDLLPQHSALELIANSEQKLTGDATRRLLTYEKVRESGEIISKAGLEAVDFRVKYFGQNEGGTRREKGAERHKQNVAEAGKRGITIEKNVSELKRALNKKRILERDRSE